MKKQIYQLTIILAISLFFNAIEIRSQDIRRVSGSFQARQERNMTPDQTRELAMEKAMIDALQIEFGTYAEQEGYLNIMDGKESFSIIGTTKVKGDWIRTTDIQFIEETATEITSIGTQAVLYITCNIKGEARKATPKAAITFQTLNCELLECRTTDYKSGENLYLYFKSPIDGYLSVFIEEGEETRRLLPYESMGTMSAVKVNGDEDYILFSKQDIYNKFPDYRPNGIKLITSNTKEYDRIYIVFSENMYYKPTLSEVEKSEEGFKVPNSLKTSKFKEWLSDNRARLTDYQAIAVTISIEKE